VISDEDLVYPIEVDPIIAPPAFTIESNQAYAYLGYSVSNAGDINGDGYADIIVGAYQYDNGQTDEGAAFVYFGSSTGLNLTPTMLEVNQGSARFGTSVSGAGDINGDGYADIIVGAYQYDNGETNEGAAFVYFGSSSGLNPTPTMLEGNQAGALFGVSVSGAGDINGDGYADIIVGAYQYDNGQTDEGAAFVYFGSSTGLNPTPTMLEGNQASAFSAIPYPEPGTSMGWVCRYHRRRLLL